MNVGLIAHDSKKKLMQNFCIAYKGILCKHNLYATGTTGKLIEEVTNLNVHKYLPGHLGGEQQMGAQIESNDMDLVIFLQMCIRDRPWAMPGYDSDVIMAAGAFIQGASIELSADAPIKPPYAVYFQGGLTWYHAKLGILMSLQKLCDAGIINL